MRFNGIILLVMLSVVFVLCEAAPATTALGTATATAAEDKKEFNSNAVDLLSVNTDTAHENESNRKARQFFYPYGGYYGGYGGYYGGYGGYGLYGYRLYPSYGYGGYPYSGFYPYYG